MSDYRLFILNFFVNDNRAFFFSLRKFKMAKMIFHSHKIESIPK